MHFRTIAGITITPNRVRHYLLFLFLEMTKKRCSRRQPPPSSGEQEKVTLNRGAHLPCRCTPFTVADDEIPERGDSNEDLLLNEKKGNIPLENKSLSHFQMRFSKTNSIEQSMN
jgi:hypothetical protein